MPLQPDKRSIVGRIKDRFYPSPDILPSQADQFISFMDESVKGAMTSNPELLDSPAFQPFYDAVKASAEKIKIDQTDIMTQRTHTRRLLLLGIASVGLFGGAKQLFDYASLPYTDPFLEKLDTKEQKEAFEATNILLGERTPSSTVGWQLSFDKYDPRMRWEDNNDLFFSPRIKNLTQGSAIYVFRTGQSTHNSGIWVNTYKSSNGVDLPVLEVETKAGADPRIIDTTQQLDPSLDMTAIRFSNINNENHFGYLAVKRITTPGGFYFEVKSLKKQQI